MLEQKAYEDMVEALCGKGQVEYIGTLGMYVGDLLCGNQRVRREINGDEAALRVLRRHDHRLGTGAAAGFQDQSRGIKESITMQQAAQGTGLIGKPAARQDL